MSTMNYDAFLNHYILNAPQIMWFLGAGASRSAGMPSASDIIWDLKRRYYCLKENRNISDNELSNEAVKAKIQSYLESQGFPNQGSEEEYAFYFKMVFGDAQQLHQKYLEEKLHPSKISINSGHRILAALMKMDLVKIIFTTNFDGVIEEAHSFMTGNDLHAYELNGAYAALNALNNESFPIYAKMHGDFRYYEMKNLPEQLVSNDAEIEKCFVNACSRYGMIVSGYSGRDKNVMAAFNKALENENAFPRGLFWITSVQGQVFDGVKELIQKAKDKGISAEIIEGDTFDSLLGAIWKLTSNKKPEFDQKIRRSVFEVPKIPRYKSIGSNYPILRTNAFPIVKMPESCLSIETIVPLSIPDLTTKIKDGHSAAIFMRGKTVLAWGSDEEIHKAIPSSEIGKCELVPMQDYFHNFRQNTSLNAFLTRAIARALVRDNPLILRRKHGRFYAVLSAKHEKYQEVEGLLKGALKSWDYNSKSFAEPKSLAGRVPNLMDTFWMECVELSLEYYDEKFWLMILPDIWIEPDINRKAAKDFLSFKKKARYNSTQNALLDAWKNILFGASNPSIIQTFEPGIQNNPIFSVCTITAYSTKTNS